MTSSGTAPTLTGDGVTLRAPRPGDAAGALEQCRDPLTRKWTTVPLDYTYADALEHLDHMAKGWQDGSEWGFVVEAADEDGTPRYAGTVSLCDERVRRAQVSYGAHPWARGRGVLERALRLLLSWGFQDRGVESVIWWASRGNWASRRLAWRLGFRVEGAPRRWLPQRGELRDAWVGTLLATDPMQPATSWHVAPRLTGERVLLRGLHSGDAPRIVAGCGDPVIARWLGAIPQPYGLEHAQEFLETQLEREAAGSAVTWALADPGSEQLVGVLNLFDIRFGADAELGYWVHAGARGRGVATEACRLALRHAFVPTEDGGLGLGRVRAVAAEENLASRRVLERAGLVHQGRERRLVLVGGQTLADAAVYDLLGEEFGS